MIPLPKAVRETTGAVVWLQSLEQEHFWRERVLWALLATLGRPESYADFGCGDGWMVRTARMAGVKPAVGFEALRVSRAMRPKWASIFCCDLTQPIEMIRQFDLVTCFGPPQPDSVLADNLAGSASGLLIIAGDERPVWRSLMSMRGMLYQTQRTDRVRDTLRHCGASPQDQIMLSNVQVFARPQQ